MNIRESDLPGIGRKFQIITRSGDKLAIIIHDSGRRELYYSPEDQPEESISMGTLDDDEARRIAGIIGGMAYMPKALETIDVELDDLVIEWYKIDSHAKCVGQTIGGMQIRLKTGATIIAIVEKSGKKNVNPGPDYSFVADSVLIIAGERQQIKAVKEILLHGGK
ncbi:MAG: cation:proton antiporter regulatory subunit [Sporomusaceae bacterium]|nr:cation:proton antiporter regulatory subunit [Sporomusaceae bacterium]